MKKLCTILVSVCALLAAAFALAGCGNEPQNSGTSGDVVLDVNSVVFTVKDDIIPLTDATSLKDYMDALQANGELKFGGSEGSYGFSVESVFGKRAEGSAYWALYTDLETIEGDEAVYSTTEWGYFVYGDKTLGYANYGVSYLPCVSGYTYALVYEVYNG